MSGQELATTAPRAGVVGLADKVEYARLLAASGMLPQQYRGRPENLLWAVEYATMLGLSPMAAITGVHVIEGKPSASAALISALVRRAGHRLRVTGDDERAVATITRADDPGFVFRSEWTIARAERAGIAGKGTWQRYPAAMLKARAISEVARDACEDALSGLCYTPEELGADVTEDGAAVDPSWSPTPPVEADGPLSGDDEPITLHPAPQPEQAGVVDADDTAVTGAVSASSLARLPADLAAQAWDADTVQALWEVYERAKAARVLTAKVHHPGDPKRSPALSGVITERKVQLLADQATQDDAAAAVGEYVPEVDENGVLL